MYVEIHLTSSSEPAKYPTAECVFEKGSFICVAFVDSNNNKMTHKYPIQNIFRVVNSYTYNDKGTT